MINARRVGQDKCELCGRVNECVVMGFTKTIIFIPIPFSLTVCQTCMSKMFRMFRKDEKSKHTANNNQA